jgi:hypothetical protein
MKTYHLPLSDKTTTDVHKYLDAWLEIANPICKLTGAEIHTLDPTITLKYDNKVFTLPVSFAKKLSDVILKIIKDSLETDFFYAYDGKGIEDLTDSEMIALIEGILT